MLSLSQSGHIEILGWQQQTVKGSSRKDGLGVMPAFKKEILLPLVAENLVARSKRATFARQLITRNVATEPSPSGTEVNSQGGGPNSFRDVRQLSVRSTSLTVKLRKEDNPNGYNDSVNGSSYAVGEDEDDGTSNGRMVPIEVALSRIRGTKRTLEIRIDENAVKSSASVGANRVVNGTATSKMVPKSNYQVSRPLLLQASDVPMRVLPTDESFRWAKDDYSKVQRSVDVWSFVLFLRLQLFLIDAKWSYPGGFSENKQKDRRRALGAWLRESILQLGPTFIKLGQLSSTRSDLLPQEFVDELSKLQDRVPAFTAEKSIALIEKELGQPINVLFREFERQPIAAASLGQVHRAVLHNGEMVVVKVQRPGLKQLFDIDLGNMKIIAELFQKSETLGGPSRDWVGIYEECAVILYQEIDYINEGRNADRFRRDFRNYAWVKVPQVQWDYTSRKVLTLEYCPGIKISDIERLDAGGFNRQLLAQRAIEAYLIQILKTGFFHADPHPGNVAVSADGTIIYYDFGMMGEIKAFTKDRLLQMFYAVYEKDAKKVIQALIDLGALVPTGDLTSVRRSIQFFLNNLTEKSNPDQDATFASIGEDLFAIAVDQPFRFPATFTFVLRAFSTLEGIGKILDPGFKFTNVAAPYAQELLDVRDGQQSQQEYLVQQLQKQAQEMSDAAVAMPIRVQQMSDIITQLEAGDLKLRVRVLEAERAARRAGVLQVATINSVAAASFLNIGVSLALSEHATLATPAFAASSVFAGFVYWGMSRVERLDKFEKKL